jgi:hypothetical protein
MRSACTAIIYSYLCPLKFCSAKLSLNQLDFWCLSSLVNEWQRLCHTLCACLFVPCTKTLVKMGPGVNPTKLFVRKIDISLFCDIEVGHFIVNALFSYDTKARA